MKVSHIVTNGCSFTYGAGLDKPTDAWPFVLGSKFGIDTVNIARSGSGNDRIFRRTYEYFYEDIRNNNHPLYVIMFSAINRQDRWLEDSKRYAIINPNDTHDPVSKDFVYNSNKVTFYRQYMLYRMALKNLFEAHNVPYIFYLAMEILENTEQKNKMMLDMTNLLPNQYDLFVNDTHYAGDASVIASVYPKTKCMHWGPLGQEAIADHAYNKINELYPNIQIESNKSYLSDSEYINLAEQWYK